MILTQLDRFAKKLKEQTINVTKLEDRIKQLEKENKELRDIINGALSCYDNCY